MGYFGERIGKYVLTYGDYQWDYVKSRKPKEYYENKTFDVEIKDLINGEEFEVEMPFLAIAEIYLLKKYYDYKHRDGSKLAEFLWKWIEENTDYQPEEYIFIYGNLSAKQYQDETLFTDTYYLQSEIGDDNVILGVEPKKHEIKSIDDYYWIHYKTLRTRYE